ncbi:hypothetical protein [Xanthomonas citri]|uniref:hypothetical protein n=1 Tax=Xanthomonas citri TaxID=346 RepID=UPI001FEF1CD3|nr:hypothetical protein [Xanthomonas citri]
MKHKILLGFSVAAIGLLFSSAAFADIGTISFYGNNARRPADLVQGCNVPEDQCTGRSSQRAKLPGSDGFGWSVG